MQTYGVKFIIPTLLFVIPKASHLQRLFLDFLERLPTLHTHPFQKAVDEQRSRPPEEP